MSFAMKRVSTALTSKNLSHSRRAFSATSPKRLQDVVIVSAARTPVGTFNGGLASFTATQLGSIAIKAVVERAKIDPKEVQEVYMGNVLQAGQGQAPARQAAIYAGLSVDTITTTVNKVCASGMKAIILASQSIMLGHQDVIVAGGMESMSNVPFYLDKARSGYRLGHGQVTDGIIKDGLWDVYNNFHMGSCAEDCARKYQITREEQDKYAIESYRRAAQAFKDGAFKQEIIPITIPQKKGNPITIIEDEEYKNINLDKVGTLKPVFEKNGTVTAANASTLNDGASAVLLMSGEKAKKLGLKPIGRVLGFADAGNPPIEFTTAPAKAIPKALAQFGIKPEQVDYYEVNEAFSVVAIANTKLLNLDPSKVNIHGGGVALGHPIGSSGCRIVVSLLNILHNKNGKIGVAGICNGGGEASSIIIEKL